MLRRRSVEARGERSGRRRGGSGRAQRCLPSRHRFHLNGWRACAGSSMSKTPVGERRVAELSAEPRKRTGPPRSRYRRDGNLLRPSTRDQLDRGPQGRVFHYPFPPDLLVIISQSNAWTTLKSHIMYALRSKYSIRLYGMIERRISLIK